MPQSGRRKSHRLKRRRRRQRRATRKQGGGGFLPLRADAIKWPPNEGCAGKSVEVVFQKGEQFDRFGPPNGTYVSPVNVAVDRVAKMLNVEKGQPDRYSYTNRALPYAGVSDGGIEGDELRRREYTETYKKDLKDGVSNYYLYEVLISGEVRGKACVVAPVFNTSGGAIQVKLEKSITTLLDSGAIKSISVSSVPGYFQRNGEIHSEETTAFST